MDKIYRRQKISHRIAMMSFAEKEKQTREIYSTLSQVIKEHSASVILCYYALPDEVDMGSVMQQCLEEGKIVLLPKIANETDIQVYKIASLDDYSVGACGIYEPDITKTSMRTGDVHMGIIPGRVFDMQGGRIGRGKGYYDRYLQQFPKMYTVGVCYQEQLIDHVPMEEWDVRMDRIVSSGSSI